MRLFLPLLLFFIVFSCAEKERILSEKAGGNFSMAIEQLPSTYKNEAISDYYSATVNYQIKEGLVGIDNKTLKIIPLLASSYKTKDKGFSYEFTLREGVLFHPSKGFENEEDRILTVDDIVSSIESACKKSENNINYAYLLIYKNNLKGADEFHNGQTKSISGIKINGNKITLQLVKKDPNFLFKLANISGAVHSKKLKGHADFDKIGTGPFKLVSQSDEKISLLRNEDYYLTDEKGCQLPYLESITFQLINSKTKQWEMFENKELDLIVGLPSDKITEIFESKFKDFNSKPAKLVLRDNPLLNTSVYLFNMKDERFKNPKVRQAFNYAIDKEKIGSKILGHQYNEMGYYGVVPYVKSIFKGYDFNKIKEVGYTYNPKKARKLMAEAGYPDGKGFGTLNLRFDVNDINSKVADEIATQLNQTLKININIDGSSFDALDKDASSGKAVFFRSGWSADYPNPETFLANFYGKNAFKDSETGSAINQANYKNKLFDHFFEKAINSNTTSESYKYYSKAEVELLKDPPFIPLWYNGDFQIEHGYLKNLFHNPLRLFNLTYVYKEK